MTRGLQLALLAAFVFLAPQGARAAWIYGGASSTADPRTSRTYTALYTAATDDAGMDTEACDALTLSWLSSISDTDATAKASFFGCPTAAFTSACKQFPTSAAATGSSFGPEKFGPLGRYTILHHTAAPAGGRTARATMVCEHNATTTAAGCKSYAFTDASVFGPLSIFGPANLLRFSIDGDAATSATTGASATVNGCIDTGYGSATCSCDMVGGEESCATYDGTSGSQGFTVIAPQAVTVTIVSATQAGTFELCTW